MSNKEKKFNIDDKNIKVSTLGTFLTKNYLKIPKYQRSYSWIANKQVSDFLNDLFDSTFNTSKWFLGLIYGHTDSSEKEELMILDGQQRITTSCIVLKELILYYQNITDENLKTLFEQEGHNKCNPTLFRPNQAPRLQLDIANRKEFALYLQEKEIENAWIVEDQRSNHIKSHKLLNAAIKKVREGLSHEIGNNLERFKQVCLELIDNTELLIIDLTNHKSFHTIFELINDRGKGLSSSDKFKNLHHYLVDNDDFEEKWFGLLNQLATIDKDIDSDIFDWYYRAVGVNDGGDFYGQLTKDLREKDSLRSREDKRKYVEEIFSSIQEMVRFLVAVENFALYQIFGFELTKEIKRHTKLTNLLLKNSWNAFAQIGTLSYSSYLWYVKNKSKDNVEFFLRQILNSIRFYVSGDLIRTQSNTLRDQTIALAKAINNGKRVRDVQIDKESDVNNYQSELTVKKIAYRITRNDNRRSKLLLFIIQCDLNPKPILDYDYRMEKFSLEHFMPRSYSSNWEFIVGESNWKKLNIDFKDIIIEDEVSAKDFRSDSKHRIIEFLGNKMVIDLGKNGEIQNNSLEEKKESLLNHIVIPHGPNLEHLQKIESYSTEKIFKRTQLLATNLIKSLKNSGLY